MESDALLFSRWEQEERPYPWSEEDFLRTIENNHIQTWVCVEDGQTLGFAVVQSIQNEAYLLNFMVNRDRRNNGVGSSFMDLVFECVKEKGAQWMDLDVAANNTPAVQFYTKKGFHLLQKRKKAYPQGEDSLMMRIQLKDQ